MNIYERLTYSSAKSENIKRENANIDGDTAMGTMLRYGSEGSKYFIINYVLQRTSEPLTPTEISISTIWTFTC